MEDQRRSALRVCSESAASGQQSAASQHPRCYCTVSSFKVQVYVPTLYTEKPWPDGLASAFCKGQPGQSHHEAVIRARLGSAYLGLAWLGSRLQAGPEQH